MAKETGYEIKKNVYIAVLFFLLASPVTFKITNEFLSYFLGGYAGFINEVGCPTPKGVFFHAVVFLALLLGSSLLSR